MQVIEALGYIVLTILIIGLVLWGIPTLFFWALSLLFGITFPGGFMAYVAFWVLYFIWPRASVIQRG